MDDMAENMNDDLVILQEVVFEDEELSTMEAQQGAMASAEGFEDEIAFAQEMEACWSLGPLRVCASVVSGGVRVTGSLFGRSILSTTLSRRRTQVCVSPSILVAKARVCVMLEIREQRVRLEGRLCMRKLFGGWRCTKFNARLLSW
jgi:hypothetical protein